jgi:hypothetical protein
MRWPACYANFYSLQSNRKTRDGSNHPDRDAQFGYINAQTSDSLTRVSRRSRLTRLLAGDFLYCTRAVRQDFAGEFAAEAGRTMSPISRPASGPGRSHATIGCVSRRHHNLDTTLAAIVLAAKPDLWPRCPVNVLFVLVTTVARLASA